MRKQRLRKAGRGTCPGSHSQYAIELRCESRSDPEFVFPYNASSETTNCFSPSLNLFKLHASFRINTINVPHEAPSKQPRPLHTPSPELLWGFLPLLPIHNYIQSFLQYQILVSSRHHTLCQLEVLFCLAITLVYLPKKGKLWPINVYSGPSTMLDLLIIRFHTKNYCTLILLLTFCITSWTRL